MRRKRKTNSGRFSSESSIIIKLVLQQLKSNFQYSFVYSFITQKPSGDRNLLPTTPPLFGRLKTTALILEVSFFFFTTGLVRSMLDERCDWIH